MLEIDLYHYNEMVRYEPAMDELRALASWITEYKSRNYSREHFSTFKWERDLFAIIKHYSTLFAEDIENHGRVLPEQVDLLVNAVSTVRKILGISDEDVKRAHENQLYKGSGFWEMRRFLGQFGDMAEEIAQVKPDHIICAGISGCVLGEYLGLKLERECGLAVPVDHMIFVRNGKLPVDGKLPAGFTPSGNQILLVEDAVQEFRTLEVMKTRLGQFFHRPQFFLFALEINQTEAVQKFLDQFTQVFTFEE